MCICVYLVRICTYGFNLSCCLNFAMFFIQLLFFWHVFLFFRFPFSCSFCTARISLALNVICTQNDSLDVVDRTTLDTRDDIITTKRTKTTKDDVGPRKQPADDDDKKKPKKPKPTAAESELCVCELCVCGWENEHSTYIWILEKKNKKCRIKRPSHNDFFIFYTRDIDAATRKIDDTPLNIDRIYAFKM